MTSLVEAVTCDNLLDCTLNDQAITIRNMLERELSDYVLNLGSKQTSNENAHPRLKFIIEEYMLKITEFVKDYIRESLNVPINEVTYKMAYETVVQPVMEQIMQKTKNTQA